MDMRRVVVTIDRLVLRVFRRKDQQPVVAGLQRELGRVFADQEAISVIRARRDLSRLRVSFLHIEHGARPQHVGERVAQSIGKEAKK